MPARSLRPARAPSEIIQRPNTIGGTITPAITGGTTGTTHATRFFKPATSKHKTEIPEDLRFPYPIDFLGQKTSVS
jgi:hypothetical protein